MEGVIVGQALIQPSFVAPPTFDSRANAATIHAKPAHDSGVGSATRQRVAHADCRLQGLPTGQLIGEVLNQPWFVGHPPPMYINGSRICVDPHGCYVPTQYQYNPATGNYDVQ